MSAKAPCRPRICIARSPASRPGSASLFWWTGADEAKPIVGEVAASSVAAHAGLRSGDEIKAINGEPVAGQRDVVFDLLDAMSSRGDAALSVRGADGGSRVATLSVPDSA